MITLYSTHCPQCTLLERQLKEHRIKYEICDDVAKMISLGFTHAPILDVDGTQMNFANALKWIREN